MEIVDSIAVVERRVRARVGGTSRRRVVRVSGRALRRLPAAPGWVGQLLGQFLELGRGVQRRVGVVGTPHPRLDRAAQPLGQVIPHVADLVELAALDHRLVEDLADGLGEGFGPVDDHQDRASGVQAALAQPDEQAAHHGGVLRRALHQRERMLDPVGVDAQRHDAQVLAEAHPVDHQRHQVHLVQRASSSASAVLVAATNRRDTADFEVLVAVSLTCSPTGSRPRP